MRLYSLSLVVCLVATSFLGAAKPSYSLISLDHRLKNQEMIQNKLREEISLLHDLLDTKQKDLKDIHQKQKLSKDTLDKKMHSFIFELGELKKHANQTRTLLREQDRRYKEIEGQMRLLASNVSHLETAFQALVKGLSKDDTQHIAGQYKVKSGDTLEKISKRHKVSIEQIKQLNQLKSDLIIIGQELKLR